MDEPFLKVENSPFNAEQVDLLNRLASTLTPEQWVWLSGYLAGVRFRLGQPMAAAAPRRSPRRPISRGHRPSPKSPYYSDPRRAMPCGWRGSCRSGSGRRISSCPFLHERVQAQRAEKDGTPVDYCEHAWRRRTAGQGPAVLRVPSRPTGSASGESSLFGPGAGNLSYKQFCQVGKRLDRRLEELGAQRLHERVDCDVDYRDQAEAWMQEVVKALGGDGATLHDGNGAAAQPQDRCRSEPLDRLSFRRRFWARASLRGSSSGELQPQRPRLGQRDSLPQAGSGGFGVFV